MRSCTQARRGGMQPPRLRVRETKRSLLVLGQLDLDDQLADRRPRGDLLTEGVGESRRCVLGQRSVDVLHGEVVPELGFAEIEVQQLDLRVAGRGLDEGVARVGQGLERVLVGLERRRAAGNRGGLGGCRTGKCERASIEPALAS